MTRRPPRQAASAAFAEIALRRLPELWRRSRVTVRDLPFALLLYGVSLLPSIQNSGTRLGELPHRPFDEPAGRDRQARQPDEHGRGRRADEVIRRG